MKTCVALQPPERLRVDDPVAVALERCRTSRFVLGRRSPLVSYERTASGESGVVLQRADPRGESVPATRPASATIEE